MGKGGHNQPRLADADPLALVVERQRHENDGLRAALRYRAVIEQAKGILVTRTGMDPESAFRQLVGHSQRTNVKLTQVAAAVVAHAMAQAPNRPRGLLTDDQILEEATSARAEERLAAAAVVAAPDFTELLDTVVQHTSDLGVRAGMLAIAEPDGALRLVACNGVGAHEVSGWQRLPPDSDVPLCRAAEQREPVWLHDRLDRLQRFPGSERFPGHREGCAAFPLVLDRQLIGCLSLEWDEPQDLHEEERVHLLHVAELCAEPVAVLLSRHAEPLPELDLEPGYAAWFQAFLDAIPVPIMLLEPQWRTDAALDDLLIVFCNAACDLPPGIAAGGSLLEAQPGLASGSLLEVVRKGWRNGGARPVDPVSLKSADDDQQVLADASVIRIGSLVALTWRAPVPAALSSDSP